jgi:hypothetical protein
MRRLFIWKWMGDYFPLNLVKTAELPPNVPYIFGYHPHGIISLGACTAFATEAGDFERKFPGINLRVLTLAMNFRMPFLNILLTSLGVCSASKRSCNAVLGRGPGNAICLVLGGARESLDAHPGAPPRLTLKNRKGFCKIALRQGASLVPCFCFGETDLYQQARNPRGSLLRRVQRRMQKLMGFALPLFKGRGVFNYVFGFLPKRIPLHVVVGAPIPAVQGQPGKIVQEPTQRQIDELHERYCTALTALYDNKKERYAPNDAVGIEWADMDE